MKENGYEMKRYGYPVKRYCQTMDLKDDPELIERSIGSATVRRSRGGRSERGSVQLVF